jgi:hypothetical protein
MNPEILDEADSVDDVVDDDDEDNTSEMDSEAV